MLICPGCKAILKDPDTEGKCPKCGHLIRAIGTATEGSHAPTLDVTAEFGPGDFATGDVPPGALTDKGPQPTIEFSGGTHRSVNIAPRKLSRQSEALITNTWQGVMSDNVTEGTSLKVDGQSASGAGSSLVVNLRGLRSPEEIARPRSTTMGSIGADYELLQVIGKGGMGVVYSARQASVDRLVAVKMIRPQVAANPERREKFLSEAVVTGDLDHPNIVPIYELGTDESNALFYSMKRVQGTPWSHVIRTKALGENLEVLMKVADAVAFAHANGVVHRDLKPENVMLGDFGEVLVMDWGLALATSTFKHTEFVTNSDSMGGTPAYMAPEMVTGPFELIGPPCDIYLLGALLFEIVTGVRPHHGKTAQDCLMAAARNEIQATDKSGELMDIAYKAMATAPSDRFPSVQDFQTAIREYHSHMESIALSTRADSEFSLARSSSDYQRYSKAVFGFEEALVLWAGNARARTGVREARLAYATTAKQRGDFELGASLLDPAIPQHAELQKELENAQRERAARQKWLSRFKRIAAGLAAAVVATITVALVLVTSAMNREAEQRRLADEQRVIAERNEAEATKQRNEADAQRQVAVAQTEIATKERNNAEAARQEAVTERDKTEVARAAAVAAEKVAEEARKVAETKEAEAVIARQGEERAAYGARIGMAAAKLEENAYDTVATLLEACQPVELRDWEWGYLRRLATGGRDFRATGTVRSVAFAPVADLLIAAGDDGVVRAWDRQSGDERWTQDFKKSVHALAVSPKDKRVAAATADGGISILQGDSGRQLAQLTGHGDRIHSVDISADGRWLVSAAGDHTARIWDLDQPAIPAVVLSGHYGQVFVARFAQSGQQIATAGEDGKVILWSFNGRAAQQQKVFVGHQGAVFAVAFAPDGQQVASAGYDKRVLIWRPDQVTDLKLSDLVTTGQPLAPQSSRSLEGHRGPVRTLQFAATGEFVISGGDDNTLRVWEVATGRPYAELRGHSRPVQTCAIAADGSQVLSGGQEGEIKLWDLVDYRPAPHGIALAGHADAVLAAAFSPDGKRVITAGGDHVARIFASDTGARQATLAEGHDFLTSRAAYFAGGTRLLTAGGDRTARIWDATTGSQLVTLENTGRNGAIAVSRDGQWVLAAMSQEVSANPENLSTSAQLGLWQLDADRKSAAKVAPADATFGEGHLALVTTVAISPDGEILFSGDDAGRGILWNRSNGAVLHRLHAHTTAMTDAAFLPDGKTLLTASKDGTVAQWDVTTGRERPDILVHGDVERRDAFDTPVMAIDVSPRGDLVATLSEETAGGITRSVLRLWDPAKGAALGELYRGDDALTSVAFTTDGSAILAAGTSAQMAGHGGGYVRRFDVAARREVLAADGKPYLDLSQHREGIWAALDAPQGDVLAVGGNGAALWSATGSNEPELTFKPHSGVTATSFSANGKLAITGSSDRRAKIWNVETGLAEQQLPGEHAGAISSARFSPVDDSLVLTAGEEGSAKLWDRRSRKVLRTFQHLPQSELRAPLAAEFSPDGSKVITAGSDGFIRVWNASDGVALATWQVESPIVAITLDRSGSRLLAGLASGTAIVLDVATGAPLVRYAGHTDAVNSVAFSPSGRRALTGSRDRLVKIWDASPVEFGDPAGNAPQVGKELLTLRYHEQAVTAVGFSPDGRSVFSSSMDGTAIVWPTEAWQ